MAIDESIYEAQRRNVTNKYSQATASNALGRFIGQQRADRGIGDYTQNFQRQAPSYSAQYGKRGLYGAGVQSGVYSNAMRNYVGDYSQGLNRMYADKQTEMNQFDLNQANYESDRQSALSDIEAAKARDIANAASYIQALRGQSG